MARVAVTYLGRDFIYFILFGIKENTGVVEFVVKQVSVNSVPIDFFEARLQLKFV